MAALRALVQDRRRHGYIQELPGLLELLVKKRSVKCIINGGAEDAQMVVGLHLNRLLKRLYYGPIARYLDGTHH